MSNIDFKKLIVSFEPGEKIYQEGSPASTMFIIHEGTVKLVKESEGGEEFVLGEFKKGDFFGELAVLGENKRTETAIALDKVKVLVITRPVFMTILKNNSEIAVRMIRKFSEKLKDANKMIDNLLKQKQFTAREPKGDEYGYLKLIDYPETIPLRSGSVLIGRYDPVIGIYPDIDISQYDPQKTVSRKHALITKEGNNFYIEEQIGVINGTYLNGEKLESGKKYKIQDGDKIYFGLVGCVFKIR